MTSEKHPRRTPAIVADAARNPGFALGAFGLSAWAYIGMSHTIADYEGEVLGWALGVAYEALVIGLAWEGRRRADLALDGGRQVSGHKRWLGGAIVVGFLSGALAAWHGWTLGEGIFAVSRAVAPVLAAVAVHLFFQASASARDVERRAKADEEREKERAQLEEARETAVLDMLDAVRLAAIAPDDERAEKIEAVNAAVGRVHRHVPAATTADVTRPHLDSERTIRDAIQEAAKLAGEWMPATIRPAAPGVELVAIEAPATAPDAPAVETATAGATATDVAAYAERAAAAVDAELHTITRDAATSSGDVAPARDRAAVVAARATDTGRVSSKVGWAATATNAGTATPAADGATDPRQVTAADLAAINEAVAAAEAATEGMPERDRKRAIRDARAPLAAAMRDRGVSRTDMAAAFGVGYRSVFRLLSDDDTDGYGVPVVEDHETIQDMQEARA